MQAVCSRGYYLLPRWGGHLRYIPLGEGHFNKCLCKEGSPLVFDEMSLNSLNIYLQNIGEERNEIFIVFTS